MAAESEKIPDNVYSLEEISKHSKDGDAWIILHGVVLDISSFVKDHPGGDIILSVAGEFLWDACSVNSYPCAFFPSGKDATEE
jgi:predicted heme/steroid binding protein